MGSMSGIISASSEHVNWYDRLFTMSHIVVIRSCNSNQPSPRREWCAHGIVDTTTQIVPVERRTLAGVVMQRIEDYVRDRPLGPGDPLPSQHELARQLGVSRPVVREALQGLAARGALEIRPGSGVYVSDPAAMPLEDGRLEIETHEAALEALEARMVLEVEMAALAAERATDDDFARMDQVLARLKRASARQQLVSRITLDFHRALARSCHNSMLYRMSQVFARAQVAQGIRVEQTLPDILAGEYENHLRLRDAVASRDPNRARAEMRHHLEVAHGWEDQVMQHLQSANRGVAHQMIRLQGKIAHRYGSRERDRRGHRPTICE